MKNKSVWVLVLMTGTLLSSLSLFGGQGDWTIQTVDWSDAGLGTGWGSSMALDTKDQPHISYYSYEYGRLCYASRSGGEWTIETLAVPGQHTSLALDSSDRPHISYFTYLQYDASLNYVYWTGSSWSYHTVVDHVNVYNDKNAPLCLDSSGYPHILYGNDHYSEWSNSINYAYWNGTGWPI